MILSLAWKNIWRKPARSLVLMLSVSFSIFSGLFLFSVYEGMGEQRKERVIEQETGHLQLHQRGFNEDDAIRFTWQENTGGQLSPVENSLLAVSSRLTCPGMLSSAASSQVIRMNGVLASDENRVSGLPGKIVEGVMLTDTAQQGILLSTRLAKKLNLQTGDKCVFHAANREGDLSAAAFRVLGLYKSGNSVYDDLYVFVHRRDLQDIMAMPDAVNEISLLLRQEDSLDVLQQRLQQHVPSMRVESWKELAPEVALVIRSLNQYMFIYLLILLLALAFGIVNTMLMAVLERTREIGMLKAIGTPSFKLFRLILFETSLLVLLGIPPGLLITWLVYQRARQTGINLDIFREAMESFGYGTRVYPLLSLPTIRMTLLMVVVTALLSALYPAWKTIRMQTLEAIRK